MTEGTGKRKLPFFRSTSTRPIARRRKSTVHTHRTIRAFLYLVAWIFLVLVVIGNVSNKPVIRSTYFLYLDLSDIIPVSVPNAVLINSIAQSIGLHDFYTVGLWNFCEGYLGQGITHCSKPETLYAFNPVDIILNELLSGASSTCNSQGSTPSLLDTNSPPSRPAIRHPRATGPRAYRLTLDVRPPPSRSGPQLRDDLCRPIGRILAPPPDSQVLGRCLQPSERRR